MYKLYTKVLTNRLQREINDQQPTQQAVPRSGASAVELFRASTSCEGKCIEHRKPLYIAVLDLEKAFDTVETRAVLASLEKQGVKEGYIKTLPEINRQGYPATNLHKDSDPISIRKGIHQSDKIAPKLCTASLGDIYKDLDWKLRDTLINGSQLKN